MKTITTIVSIGKSKAEIAYTFLKSDFVRIENDVLFLKSDNRKLTIAEDQVKEVICQMNDF